MINKEKIIKKIKSLTIVKELKITDKEIEKLFASFNTYININEICENSNEENCYIHHHTYIRNPKTNNIIEVKCFCDKQKNYNQIEKRILYCSNRKEILELIKKPNSIKDVEYQTKNSQTVNDISTINSKGLYVYGDPYIGKTAFLFSLLQESYTKTNNSISFVNAKDLFEKLSNKQEWQKEINELIRVETLFIDNFGLEKWPKNYFFEEELINFFQERLNCKKSNFISAAMSIDELKYLYKSRKMQQYQIKFLVDTIKKLTNNIEIKLIKICH